MLKLLAISKRFGGVVALDRVNLSLNRGEVLAVIGENGAGKSTLMNILGGVVAPDGGSILLDEKPVQIRSVSDSVGLGIGFVHQELNLLDNLDVAGNLFLGREPRRLGWFLDGRAMERRSRPHLERLGLRISPRTALAELSLAQRQMAEIAKALSLDADINSRRAEQFFDEYGDAAAARGRQGTERGGGGHRLHLAPAWRDQADRPSRCRPARRKECGGAFSNGDFAREDGAAHDRAGAF